MVEVHEIGEQFSNETPAKSSDATRPEDLIVNKLDLKMKRQAASICIGTIFGHCKSLSPCGSKIG